MKKILFVLGLASLAACKPNLKVDPPNANGVDFSSYVAVGNSLTAGYSDGTLYRSGQINSYPNILADQMRIFGALEFKQPLMPGEYGFPKAKLVLGYAQSPCDTSPSLSPVPFSGLIDTAGSATNIADQGPFNNFGIPGIRAIDFLIPGYALAAAASGFPYAARMFNNPTVRPLDELKLKNPTFFTLWLGNNDVLGYALAGGEENPSFVLDTRNISNTNSFINGYDSVLSVLTRTGAKGVLLNIPDVTSIPFFHTIPANGLPLDTNSAALLNSVYASHPSIRFHVGANYFVVEDPAAPGGRRQLKPNELVLLSAPQDSIKCYRWGSAVPLPKKYVLDSTELSRIKEATTAFNNHIASMSVSMNLPLVDANAFLRQAITGITFNGVTYNTEFVTGGTFSLDGVHLTPRGNAIVANEIIKAINAYYKSTIPMIDIHKYGGIRFPM